MRVGVFHPGTQHSHQVALAFQEAGNLAWHATSVFYMPERWPYRVERYLPAGLAARVGRELRRRYHPSLEPRLVRQFGFDEWVETGARRLGLHGLAARINRTGNRRFGHAVTRLIEREPVDAVWGFNTSALDVFRWAKPRGLRCILDQTIGHPRSMNRILEAERAVHPDCFLDDGPPFDDADIACQEEEMALADAIVCGSDYCARTLIENGCPAEKIKVVPYGYDETLFPDAAPGRPALEGRPVNLLFVGEIGPRKGVPYLLEAFGGIAPEAATLTLVGHLGMPEAALRRRLGRACHISHLPRNELIRHYVAADCFVFPSLFEGGGIVLYEAAAAGCGLIQTSFCGDGVREGANGLVLDRVTVEAVADALRTVAGRPDMLQRWQEASWRMRGERSWAVYRQTVRSLIVS